MPSSPYQQARAPDPVRPRPNAVPAFAIIVNVPTSADYAARPFGTPVAIAISFHQSFVQGSMQEGYKSIHPSVFAAEGLTLDPAVYLNFDLDRLGDFCVPPSKPNALGYDTSIALFIDRVVKKYRAYTRPTPYEFCLPDDADFALSKRMTNPLATQNVYLLQASKKAPVVKVYSLTDAWWKRQNTGQQIVTLTLLDGQFPINYRTDEYLFEPTFLDPLPDAHGWADTEIYLADFRSKMKLKLRHLNGVINAISNFGDRRGMDEGYRARLDRLCIEIGGHTDRQGNESYNERLSKQRADDVAKKMLESMAGVLTYPAAAGQVPDLISRRLRTRGYGWVECGAAPDEPCVDCRKASLRFALRP